MEIQRFQYEAAYKVGLERHDGAIGLAEASKRLESTGLNEASAKILLGNVSYLLRGEVYKRAFSIPATDDFLAWIHRDRGREGLANAVLALRAHIEYQEAVHKVHRVGLRDVLARYTALLDSPQNGAILLEYDETGSRGYIDILPLDLFVVEGSRKAVVHSVRDRRNGKDYQAKCDIFISGSVADLDYEKYEGFNSKNGMLSGFARLIFNDVDRTSIESVAWKPITESVFKNCGFKDSLFGIAVSGPYIPPVESAEKVPRMIRERPGQVAFRKSMKLVHGNRCCISGCRIADVLEGAHIDPYLSEASDNIRNGLLLRSDIHRLFDRHLIAIDPSSYLVHVADAVKKESAYNGLAGIFLQLPANPEHHPDKGALGRHWQRFRKAELAVQ